MSEKELQSITAADVGEMPKVIVSDPSPPALAFTPTSLPDTTVGTTYSQTITVSGGTPPYAVTVAVTTPIAGLTATTDGLTVATVTGPATAAGQFAFSVSVTDSANATATANYTVNAVPLPVINPFPPPPPAPPIPALEVRAQAILNDWLTVVIAVKNAYLSLQSDTTNDPNYTYAQIVAALGNNGPNMQIGAIVIKKLINMLFPGTITDSVPDCTITLPS